MPISANRPSGPALDPPNGVLRRVYVQPTRSGITYLVGPVLLVLAAWFSWGPDWAGIPAMEAVAVPGSAISREPTRLLREGPPGIEIAGIRLRCMDCHRLFDSRAEVPGRPLVQHTDIILDHGINDRCGNCHDYDDRDRLIVDPGRVVAYAQVPLLCAKCHGPTYRDWERGIHGRTSGYWDASRGKQRRLKCIECHDPHAPAVDPVVPLPGPDTLRMGDPGTHRRTGSDGTVNPLGKWRSGRISTDEDRDRSAPSPTEEETH